MQEKVFFNKSIIKKSFIVFGMIIIPIYLSVSIINLPVFVTLVELSIIIVCVIFSIVGLFTSFRMKDNIMSKLSPYVFVYTIFLLLHILSSKNVDLFMNTSETFSFNIWIVGNILLAFGFMFTILDEKKILSTINHVVVVTLFSVVLFFLTYYDIFPATLENNQTTTYGIISQIFGIFIYILTMFFWLLSKEVKSNPDHKLFFFGIIGLFISEILMFNHYTSIGVMIYISLTLRHLTFLLLLYNIFDVNLIQPYNVLYESIIKDNELQRKLKDENAQNLRRLQRSQSIGHVGSWELDLNTRVLWASDEAFKIYNLDITENNTIPLKTVQSIVDKKDRSRLDFALLSLIERGVPYDVFFRINVGNNRHRDVNSVATLKYNDGKPDKVYGVINDITNVKTEQEKLRYTSYHDHLTGLYNRRYFVEQRKVLDTEKNYPLACILLDINGLKIINDSFGHKAGNRVLRKVSTILDNNKKNDSCFVARIGGDEFAVMCPNTSKEMAEYDIQNVLEKFNLEKVGNITLSVAYGISVKTSQSETFDEVLTKAEDDMYMNKISSSLSFSNKIIDSLLNTLYDREHIAEEHSTSVSKYSRKLAIALDLSPKKINDISMIARVHDIGKLGLSDELLNKKGKLTDEEYDLVKSHSEKGYKIIKSLSGMDLLATHVLHHHERWDGFGYPSGLKGDEISVEARIISICDAFDAMTNQRDYKEKLTFEEAIKELKKERGKQFDPAMTDVFIREVLNKTVGD